MRARVVLAAVVGAWLGLTAAAFFVAPASFSTVARLRAGDRVFAPLPEPERGLAFRYVASELNRTVFSAYVSAQMALAATATLLALASRRSAALGAPATVALGLALFLSCVELALTPRIVELGRAIDFLPRDPLPEDARVFATLHAVYVGADVVKAGALVGLIAALARSGSAPRQDYVLEELSGPPPNLPPR
jgi:hypothetical protein